MTEGPRKLRPVTFGQAEIDRAADLRDDPLALERLRSDASTRSLVVVPGGLAMKGTVPDWKEQVPAGEVEIFLGRSSDGPRFAAVHLDGRPGEIRDLRSVAFDLAPQDAALAVAAVSLANWHATHRFCPRCGSPTEPVNAGWVRRCTADGSDHFPRTDPAVIVAVTDRDDRLLVGRGIAWPPGRFSVLAGFAEPGETLVAAVRREIGEEVGIEIADIEYAGDQPWPFPASLMVAFRARALSTDLRVQERELAEAKWITRDQAVADLQSGRWQAAGQLSIARALIEEWFGGPLP